MDLTLIKVAEQKPLSVKEGSGVGKLFDALSIPASVFCERQGIDLLVGGMVRDVEGYVLLDVWAYDAASNSVVVTLPGCGAEGRGVPVRAPGGQAAHRTVPREALGRHFLRPDPPGGSLFVGGKLVATGRTPLLYLTPGTLDIKVSAPGYRDLTQTMSLGDAEEASVSVTLEKEKTGTVVISSTPSGADVYVESVWKGKTPLSLETPFQPDARGHHGAGILRHAFLHQRRPLRRSFPSSCSLTRFPGTRSRRRRGTTSMTPLRGSRFPSRFPSSATLLHWMPRSRRSSSERPRISRERRQRPFGAACCTGVTSSARL